MIGQRGERFLDSDTAGKGRTIGLMAFQCEKILCKMDLCIFLFYFIFLPNYYSCKMRGIYRKSQSALRMRSSVSSGAAAVQRPQRFGSAAQVQAPGQNGEGLETISMATYSEVNI